MLINQFYERGFYQYVFDDRDEAIAKANFLYKAKNFGSVSVIKSNGLYYVESPADNGADFIRSWEVKIYYNGKEFNNE